MDMKQKEYVKPAMKSIDFHCKRSLLVGSGGGEEPKGSRNPYGGPNSF